MPESKEETLREIERLTEWCNDMIEMMLTDGTVPATSMGIYHKQTVDGQARLLALKDKARENGWI